MKSLSLIVLVAASFGALALSGCSGCSQSGSNTNAPAAPAVTCGPGTAVQGNQCVGRAN